MADKFPKFSVIPLLLSLSTSCSILALSPGEVFWIASLVVSVISSFISGFTFLTFFNNDLYVCSIFLSSGVNFYLLFKAGISDSSSCCIAALVRLVNLPPVLNSLSASLPA